MAITRLRVDVLVDAAPSRMDRAVAYVKSSVKSSCRNMAHGSVALGVYQEDRLVGLDVSGRPTRAMREMVNDLFSEEVIE